MKKKPLSSIAILTTHRRGCGLLIVKNILKLLEENTSLSPEWNLFYDHFQKNFCLKEENTHSFLDLTSHSNLIPTLFSTLWKKLSLRKKTDLPSEEIVQENFYMGRVLGFTTEHLAQLYTHALKSCQLTDNDISHIIIGEGPGSFTGLRMGAAFVNGLQLGSPRTLLQIKSLLIPELLILDSIYPDLQEELGTYSEQDDSTGFITFCDILSFLPLLHLKQYSIVGTVVPNYGRECGPVLKLQEKNALKNK